ncbi:MAG: SAM-dependent methyltransferase [Clostridiales bacterium]|nr:SAM-dependent methyltransferase [Clostridiales bacterium]
MERTEVLSPRLQTVASMIPSCETIVDVGSDHGKLGAWCLRENLCRKVIATDIHELPAKRTAERMKEENFEERSEVLVTDGLKGVSLSSDMTAVIAGMGGLEICKILNSALKSDDSIPKNMAFVLQPQRSFYEVRSFLSENGFSIRKEKISIERGHFYVVIFAVYNGEAYDLSDEELFLGPVILKDRPENYSEYIAHEEQLMRKRALGEKKCAEILKNWEKYL